MSWDVVVVGLPCTATLEALQGELPPLGARSEVMRRVLETIPDVDFEDPSYGVLEESEHTIEFNLGEDDPVREIVVHVRGGGDVLTLLKGLCAETGWNVFDMSTNQFIDFSKPESGEGWRLWQAFQERVRRGTKERQ